MGRKRKGRKRGEMMEPGGNCAEAEADRWEDGARVANVKPPFHMHLVLLTLCIVRKYTRGHKSILIGIEERPHEHCRDFVLGSDKVKSH